MRPLMPPVQTPDNLFHDGNPLTGELGTIVDAEHLNNEQAAIRDTQSELIAILTAAAMEPESTAGQLLAALNKLYAPLNDTLGALSSLVGAANKLPYFTAANAAALTALSSIGRDIIGKATVAEVLTYLGLGDSDGFVGRLLAPPLRLTASGVYTPSPEAKYALVELQAAGGNGGNAPATGSGVVGIAVGGSAGGYAKFLVKISDITNFNYTIGVHASSSNSATAGGSSSFCGVTCAGGTGSTLAGTSSGSSPVQSRGLLGGNVTNAGTTPLTLIESIQGDTSGNALYTSPGNSVSGNGASSRFAPGPIGIGGSSGSGINAKDGAGGSGANSTNNPGGGFTGGLGGDGLMIIWELA
ncbi:hypothetical protein [Enterobacter roggenkampii]|uniref:hypothetical protein n=1 Tax=Enterobacter roggenkampii TaxID=1812935 RepID=UPI0028764350|nr:hypothetical protein [Enterobacter roggenkampii]MDS0044333.1 hypothetical protein [Enterobacter roggenkampii]